MAIFEIFKNPVEMIDIMSELEFFGKKYKQGEKEETLPKIEALVDSFADEFAVSGVPLHAAKAHCGIIFEMTLKGDDIPPLAALEFAIKKEIDEGQIELEVTDSDEVDDLLGSITKKDKE